MKLLWGGMELLLLILKLVGIFWNIVKWWIKGKFMDNGKRDKSNYWFVWKDKIKKFYFLMFFEKKEEERGK